MLISVVARGRRRVPWLVLICDSVAGIEPIAALLCGLMNHLLWNLEIFDSLRAEVRGAIESEDDLVMEKLEKLPWVNACIEEDLRLFPPVPIRLFRTVPKGGGKIDGHVVPEAASHQI